MTDSPFSLRCRWMIDEGQPVEGAATIVAGRVVSLRAESSDVRDLGDIVLIPPLINAHTHAPMTLLRGFADDMELNTWLKEHIWPVENRFVGMKSRGVYETPGGTIMLEGHRGIEQVTLDRGAGHLKDEIMPRYAELVYNGYWWSPERKMMQQMIDASQRTVNGVVRVKLFKGAVTVVGRKSETNSLFDEAIVTFEDDRGAYDQKDAEGFIKLNALRMRIAGKQ